MSARTDHERHDNLFGCCGEHVGHGLGDEGGVEFDERLTHVDAGQQATNEPGEVAGGRLPLGDAGAVSGDDESGVHRSIQV